MVQEIRKKVGMWDKGLNYEETFNRIALVHLASKRKETRTYSAILLVQARNGSRIGESVKCFKEWVATGKKVLEIPLEKKKKKDPNKPPETRLFYIPKILLQENREEYKWVLEVDDKVLKQRVVVFCRNAFGFNSHSLRYSFVTYELKKGVNVGLVSQMLGHSDMRPLIAYVQTKEANKELEEAEPQLKPFPKQIQQPKIPSETKPKPIKEEEKVEPIKETKPVEMKPKEKSKPTEEDKKLKYFAMIFEGMKEFDLNDEVSFELVENNMVHGFRMETPSKEEILEALEKLTAQGKMKKENNKYIWIG
jgi:hypothetical protein